MPNLLKQIGIVKPDQSHTPHYHALYSILEKVIVDGDTDYNIHAMRKSMYEELREWSTAATLMQEHIAFRSMQENWNHDNANPERS